MKVNFKLFLENWKKYPYQEGGKAVKGSRLSGNDIIQIENNFLKDVFKLLKLYKYTKVGSWKNAVPSDEVKYGDIDLLFDLSYDEFIITNFEELEKYCEENHCLVINNKGTGFISIGVPIGDKTAQVDFTFSKNYESAKFHFENEGSIKGVYRNMLLNWFFKCINSDYRWSPKYTGLKLEDGTIVNDMKAIQKVVDDAKLVGSSKLKKDFKSFESIWNIIKTNYKNKTQEIKDDMLKISSKNEQQNKLIKEVMEK